MKTATARIEDPVTNVQPVERVVVFGNFGPPSLTFARSCHAMGISVYLLTPGAAGGTAKIPSSCIAGAAMLDAAIVGQARGIEAIVDYARHVGAEALATISDAHCLWLSKNRVHFESVCRLLLPPADCLERLASKVDQIALAQEAGLKVLPTYVIRGSTDVARIGPEDYPVCLRPATAAAAEPSFKVSMARSPDELRRFIGEISLRDALIAQPLRVLPNMVVHCTSRGGGELMSTAAFLVDRKFEGLALRMRPMPVPEGLEEKLQRFSSAARLSGTYHFDFLYSPQDGESYYLEVNARFGGTTDKVIWFDVNEPANCLLAYGLATPRPPRRYRKRHGAVANKRATLKHLITMLREHPTPWDYPQESRVAAVIHSLGDLLIAKDSICDWQDLKGTQAFHLQG